MLNDSFLGTLLCVAELFSSEQLLLHLLAGALHVPDSSFDEDKPTHHCSHLLAH